MRTIMKSLIKTPIAALGITLAMLTTYARAGEFVVDKAKSSIQVDVKATGHDFTAKLNKYTIKVTGSADKAHPDSVKLTWNFKDLGSGDAKRDKEMLHWMEHAKLPSGSFTLSSFTKRTDGKMWAKGNLKIHGVSKVVQFPVTSVRKGKSLTVSGAVRIDHQNFGLKKIRKVLLLTVDPVLNIRFKLHGTIK
jgi:polyisoprenoid-binding protein YceI